MCLNDSNCVYVIHFYQNQSNSYDENTFERKPLDAEANTCILRNEFNIQSGTNKDSSANIYYLTGRIN